MKHAELLRTMALEAGSIQKAREAYEVFLRALYLGLVRDGEVRLKDLGVFRVFPTPPSALFSGLTGKEVRVPASKRVTFKASSVLRRALKDEDDRR